MRKFVFAATLLLFASTAFADGYPPEIPKDFKNAPKKVVCERETPTVIHISDYINNQEGWIITISGRNGKDNSISFWDGRKPLWSVYLLTNNGWKKGNWTEEELEEHKKLGWNEEEVKFFTECFMRLKQPRQAE